MIGNLTHAAAEPTEFGNWSEKAKRKFAGATIHNSGQFAVCVMDHKNVYLFDDFFAATDFMEGHPQYRLFDLAETTVQKMNVCGNIKSQSDYEDRLWEKKQA
jgi:hypothetical protein